MRRLTVYERNGNEWKFTEYYTPLDRMACFLEDMLRGKKIQDWTEKNLWDPENQFEESKVDIIWASSGEEELSSTIDDVANESRRGTPCVKRIICVEIVIKETRQVTRTYYPVDSLVAMKAKANEIKDVLLEMGFAKMEPDADVHTMKFKNEETRCSADVVEIAFTCWEYSESGTKETRNGGIQNEEN